MNHNFAIFVNNNIVPSHLDCRHKAQSRKDIDHKEFFKYDGILEVSLEYPGSDFKERFLTLQLYYYYCCYFILILCIN